MRMSTRQVLCRGGGRAGADDRRGGEPRGFELHVGAVRVPCVYVGLCVTAAARRYPGGWLAPNIYFLGFAGCVRAGGVRIAGASGIYKAGDYALGAPPPPLLRLH